MKVTFVEARKKVRKDLDIKEIKNKLPKKIHLLYTIQYKNLAKKLKQELTNEGFRILASDQVLGCSRIKPKATLLLIGSGKFHALQIAIQTQKPIFIYEHGKVSEIERKDIEKFKSKEKAKLAKFYSAENHSHLYLLKNQYNCH